MTEMILDASKNCAKAAKEEMKKAEGRVSFTMDLWSDPVLDSYMAIMAHYVIRDNNHQLEYRSDLIVFRYIEGSHMGVNLANHFLIILEEMDLLYKVSRNNFQLLGNIFFFLNPKIGVITMDNASNNNTLMGELESLLESRNILFDRDGNHIRSAYFIIL